MSTRNWVIGIILVIVVIVIGVVAYRPAGERAMTETQAPATTEQPAASAQSEGGAQSDAPETTGSTDQSN